MRDLRPLAARRGLDLSATTEPIVVTGDAERLSEAVTNVVANAIQYNVDGGRVRVRLTAAQGLAEVEVADTGVGIAPADLPHVFDPFFRADPARSREAGGAGLGLTLTRAIVERHGGQVTCDSHPGQGTVVRIWLRPAPPAAPADTPTAA